MEEQNIQIPESPESTQETTKATSNTKKRIISIACLAVLISIIAFIIFWISTEDIRSRMHNIKEIDNEIADFRTGESDYLFFIIPDELITDDVFVDYLCSEIRKMCANNEYELLHEFTFELILTNDFENYKIIDTLVECFSNASTLDEAVAIREEFSPVSADGFSYWNKIEEKMILNLNQNPISSYIEQNGTRTFCTTAGEGFYAGLEPESSTDVVGIPGSPLHSSEETTYLGDFKFVHWWGVRLNYWYEEEHYGGYSYYFREQHIPFSPLEGECIWSGDYLFCFAPDGQLVNYAYLTTH